MRLEPKGLKEQAFLADSVQAGGRVSLRREGARRTPGRGTGPSVV